MSEEAKKEEEEIEISPDKLKLMEEDISELATILSNNSEIGDRIREVVDYHLKESIDFKTYRRIGYSLEKFVGAGAARLIMNYLHDDDIFKIIQKQIKNENVSGILPFLQYLTAIYGIKIKEAYILFQEDPDDWQGISVTSYREGRGDVWFIDVNIAKYNDEAFFLKMSPLSAFQLVQNLLNEMENVPKEVVEDDVIEKFRKETEGFRKKFLDDDNGED